MKQKEGKRIKKAGPPEVRAYRKKSMVKGVKAPGMTQKRYANYLGTHFRHFIGSKMSY